MATEGHLVKTTDRIYIAGHRGLVGSAIWRALEAAGFSQLLGRTSAELDLRDPQRVAAFFEAEKPDAVVLAAARVGGILANATQPVDFISDNLRIQVNVFDAARRQRTRRLLFLGSSCIYPKFAPQPIPEAALLTGPLEPTNDAYAIAKIAGIIHVQALRRQYGLPYVCAMPTNLYGPGDNFDLDKAHVLPALLRRFHEAKIEGVPEVVVWGTGQARREFMHVDDLASAAVQILQRYDEAEPINVGTGMDVSIAELAAMIARVVGYEGRISYDTSKPDGTPRKWLDISKLEKLGFSPDISLETGLTGTYAWYRGQIDTDPSLSGGAGCFRAKRSDRAILRSIRVGGHQVTDEVAWRLVQRYSREQAAIVENYDCARTERAVPEVGVTLASFARLLFLDRSLSAVDAISTLDAAAAASWDCVPLSATLIEADPDEQGGLYDAAEHVYRHFLKAVPRLGPGAASGLLHLQRPSLFPLLQISIRRLYEARAIETWEQSKKAERPRSGRSYWPVIRADLLDSYNEVAQWRSRLASSDLEADRRLATVSDVRLWDVVASSLAASYGLAPTNATGHSF